MSRARQYGFLRLDPQGDDYSDLYVPVEIIQWFENDAEVEIRTADNERVTVDAEHVLHALQDHFQGCEDLLTLRDFSEPALLHTLRVRFSRRESYTAVGTILVSVNPYSYHNYEETYGEEVMDLYRRATPKQLLASTSLPPHLYAVAERAVRHAYSPSEDGASAERPKDQAIVISGESGSGKTEATKLVVQYLAWRSKAVHNELNKKQQREDSQQGVGASSGGFKSVFGNAGGGGGSMGSGPGGPGGSGVGGVPIEERIVSTTPLLEALGNARTLRNDNSSRFGKFMRLFMADDGTLVGCKIEQYLLEVTRVVKQAEGENNFHVLMQLLEVKAGAAAIDAAAAAGPTPVTRRLSSPGKPNSSPNGKMAGSLGNGSNNGGSGSNGGSAGSTAFKGLFDAAMVDQLSLKAGHAFHYLSRGGNVPVAGTTDGAGLAATLGCLQALNLETQEVAALMRLLAAVLHLGNLEISDAETDWPLTSSEKAAGAGDGHSGDSSELGADANGGTLLKGLAKKAVSADRAAQGDAGDADGKAEWGSAIAAHHTRGKFAGAVQAKLNEQAIHTAASLAHLDPDKLMSVIKSRRIVLSHRAANDEREIEALRSPADAHSVRDAICKAIYGRVWQSVIRSLNSYLDVSKSHKPGSSAAAGGGGGGNGEGDDSLEVLHFIGLLDFAGFEQFFEHPNGFEQLLINYANEMLQWHFNCFIFEVEIAEYHHEGVDTTDIAFRDNEPCVQLIESPYMGIISKLDDSCIQGDTGEIEVTNDLHREKRFIRHLYDTFGTASKADLGDMNEAKLFYFRPRHEGDFCFGVRHYAGDVIYDTRDCWADKNNDSLSHDAQQLLEDGVGNPYIRRVLRSLHGGDSSKAPSSAPQATARTPGRLARKQSALFQRSIGRRFADSLKALIGKITACYPQFVRCVKPNHHKSPEIFAGFLTFRQLVNSGMIEAINARQAGFPVRIPHAEFLTKFACLVKAARWAWQLSSTVVALAPPVAPPPPLSSEAAAAAAGGADEEHPALPVREVINYGRLITSQLACLEDDPLAQQELQRRSNAFVAELHQSMHEVVHAKSTQVGKTKVFMKATFAYTLHRIAEITEHHWVRKLQKCIRKYLRLGAREREMARARYRALLEAANAALAASRKTRPRKRANLAAETSIAGFKRRLDNLSLGPAAQIYSSKLELILSDVNKKMDAMMDQCKRIKKAESGMEKAETDRLKVNLESMRKTHGFNAHTAASSSSSPGSNGMNLVESLSAMGRDPESGLNRDDLDSPQVLYKFTRLMERQIGEAESMSRALGDALEERRQFQSRVWEIYERFVVNEASADLRLGLKPVVDQVIADAEAALGTKFDEIELDGIDGDRMLDRRIAVLIAHKEITSHERDMLARWRVLVASTEEKEGFKARLGALDGDYRLVLEQVELFMELCQAVSSGGGGSRSSSSKSSSSSGVPSAELMVHMQRVHQAVESAEAALEQVMFAAERRERAAAGAASNSSSSSGLGSFYSASEGGAGLSETERRDEAEAERYCRQCIADAAAVVLRETNSVEQLGRRVSSRPSSSSRSGTTKEASSSSGVGHEGSSSHHSSSSSKPRSSSDRHHSSGSSREHRRSGGSSSSSRHHLAPNSSSSTGSSSSSPRAKDGGGRDRDRDKEREERHRRRREEERRRREEGLSSGKSPEATSSSAHSSSHHRRSGGGGSGSSSRKDGSSRSHRHHHSSSSSNDVTHGSTNTGSSSATKPVQRDGDAVAAAAAALLSAVPDSSVSSPTVPTTAAGWSEDNADGLVVMASLDLSHLSLDAQAKVKSPNASDQVAGAAAKLQGLNRSAKLGGAVGLGAISSSTSNAGPTGSSTTTTPSSKKASSLPVWPPPRPDQHQQPVAEAKSNLEGVRASPSTGSSSRSSKSTSSRSNAAGGGLPMSSESRRVGKRVSGGDGTSSSSTSGGASSSSNGRSIKAPFESIDSSSGSQLQASRKASAPSPPPPPAEVAEADAPVKWTRPTLQVLTADSTGAAAGTGAAVSGRSSSSSLDPTSPTALSPSAAAFRQLSFAEKVAEQEERRRRLDELQAARDKVETDQEEAAAAAAGVISDSVAKEKAEMMAKMQLRAEQEFKRRTGLMQKVDPLTGKELDGSEDPGGSGSPQFFGLGGASLSFDSLPGTSSRMGGQLRSRTSSSSSSSSLKITSPSATTTTATGFGASGEPLPSFSPRSPEDGPPPGDEESSRGDDDSDGQGMDEVDGGSGDQRPATPEMPPPSDDEDEEGGYSDEEGNYYNEA